jgi:hypothetical protein
VLEGGFDLWLGDNIAILSMVWVGHTNHLFRLFRSRGIHGQINSRCGFEPGVHQSFTSIDQPEGRTISSNLAMCKMFHLPMSSSPPITMPCPAVRPFPCVRCPSRPPQKQNVSSTRVQRLFNKSNSREFLFLVQGAHSTQTISSNWADSVK